MTSFRKNTLRYLLLVAAAAFVSCASIAQDEKPSPNLDPDGVHTHTIVNPPQSAPSFTLAISAKAPEFRVGSRVSVDVTMNNITKHTIDHSDWYSDAGEMSYSIDVRDEDGKPAEKIVHEHPELDTPSYIWGAIPPGESVKSKLRISSLYKLDRPGKYVIQVSRPDIDFKDADGKFVKVYSNTITITITG
jgi:hypothetical protein